MAKNIGRKKIYLRAEMIYKYLIGDEDMETLVFCKPGKLDMLTTDQSLYEAIGSIKDKDSINYNKLVKFLENVDVLSFRHALKKKRTVLRDDRVREIIVKAKEKTDLDDLYREVKNAREKD